MNKLKEIELDINDTKPNRNLALQIVARNKSAAYCFAPLIVQSCNQYFVQSLKYVSSTFIITDICLLIWMVLKTGLLQSIKALISS